MAALRHAGALVRALLVAAGCCGGGMLAGCATQRSPPEAAAAPAAPSGPAGAATARGTPIPFRCGGGLRISVRFEGDTVQVAGLPRGDEVLLRDAGGLTPEQSVWSNPRLRAEFGLGERASQAVLQPLEPPAEPLHCTRAE